MLCVKNDKSAIEVTRSCQSLTEKQFPSEVIKEYVTEKLVLTLTLRVERVWIENVCGYFRHAIYNIKSTDVGKNKKYSGDMKESNPLFLIEQNQITSFLMASSIFWSRKCTLCF